MSKHEKYKIYAEDPKLKDTQYYGIVPILAHADHLKKIPAHLYFSCLDIGVTSIG